MEQMRQKYSKNMSKPYKRKRRKKSPEDLDLIEPIKRRDKRKRRNKEDEERKKRMSVNPKSQSQSGLDTKKTRSRPKPVIKTSTSEPLSSPSRQPESKSKPKKKKVYFKRMNSDSSNQIIDSSSTSSAIIDKNSPSQKKRSTQWNHHRQNFSSRVRVIPTIEPKIKSIKKNRQKRKKDKKLLLKSPMNAIRKMRPSSSENQLSIRKLPFQRLVKHHIKSLRKNHSHENLAQLRVTKEALQVMQIVTEMKIVRMLEDAYLCTLHGKRVTLMNRDIQLLKKLKTIHDAKY